MTRLSLSFDRLWVWIALALPAFLALLVPMPAVDLAYQVRAGDEILPTGALPAVDTWTFTVAGTPWVDQQWLAQVVLAAGHAIGGWELLAVLRAALVVAASGLMVATALERGAAPRTAAILALAGFAIAAPAMALRPQLFGIVLFALLIWLVAIRERRPRAIWVAPVLIVLWANLHGSFVLGPRDPRLRVARGRRRGAALADVARVLVGGDARDPRQPVRARRVDVRREHRRQPGDLGSGLRVAAHVAAGRARDPVLPGGRGHGRPDGPPSLARPLAGLAPPAGMALLGAWAVRGVAWWPFVMVFLLAPASAGEPGVRTPRNGAEPVTA